MRHVGNAVPPLLAAAIRAQISQDLVNFIEGNSSQPSRTPSTDEKTKQRSAIMRAVPAKNTSVELLLRKALSAAGVRGYRTHAAKVPGNPDIVFGRLKVAVFVDGCFWHGCPRCYRAPSTNQTYWRMKVQRNQDRDKAVTAQCSNQGWTVVRIWEHDIARNPDLAAKKVISTIKKVSSKIKK
jgi:DNA mismatch endonuclease Vsr